jgi:hypothetical protein
MVTVKARQGKTRQDKTRQDARQDKTRQDKTRQDKTRQDKTSRHDKTRTSAQSDDPQGYLQKPKIYIIPSLGLYIFLVFANMPDDGVCSVLLCDK